MTCGDTRHRIGYGIYAAHHDGNVGGQHATEAKPLAQEHLPTWDRLRRDRLNGPGGDLTGESVDGRKNGHEHRQQVNGIEAHGHHCEGDFPAQDRTHAMRGKVSGLKMEARTKQSEECNAGGQCHPQHFLACGFAECHSGHDPDAHHSPPSVPTISRKRSSSEGCWGVTSYTSTPLATR